jgi:hypothetical protein
MKVLIRNDGSQEGNSVVVVSEPEKEKIMMRFLIGRNYNGAIKYLLNCAGTAEIASTGKSAVKGPVDLVITPKSVHWDLVSK